MTKFTPERLAPQASPILSGDARAVTPAPGDQDTSIATTAFVAAALIAASGTSITVSTTAPPSPVNGSLWFDLGTGTLAIYINDGTSIQWVALSTGAALNTPVGVPQSGRLTYVSATALKFAPFNGNIIKIGGSLYSIPAAGIAGLANTGVFVNGTSGQNLAANTTYTIYAFVSGAVTADFRTDGNGHITDTTTGNEGVEVRCSAGTTPDPSRTLIGLIRTNASSQFADAVTQRFVRSWFNDPGCALSSFFTAARTTTVTANFVEVNTEIRIEFVSWAGEIVYLTFVGICFGDGTATMGTAIGVDGTTPEDAGVWNGNTGHTPTTVQTYANPTEGYHYATVLGRMNAAGTGTWGLINNSVGRRSTLKGYLRR